MTRTILEPHYPVDKIREFHGGKVNLNEQRLVTVLAVTEDGTDGEEFDIIAPRYAPNSDVQAFVEAILKKDFKPGMRVEAIDGFHGVFIH